MQALALGQEKPTFTVFDISVLFFLFIVPFFPLPKTVLGFLAPLSVIFLFGFLVLQIATRKIDLQLDININTVIVCFFLLIVFDLINGMRFESLVEFKYVFARVTTLIVTLLVVSYLQNNPQHGIKWVMLAILFSAVVVSILIILEGFGLVSTGIHSEMGRRLFGIRIPIRKATGVPLSDGKLGTLLIPSLTMLLIPGLLSEWLHKRWRLLFIFLLVIGILIMQSRSGWLGLFAGWAFLIAYYINRSKYIAFHLLAVTLMAGILFFSPVGEAIFAGFVGEGIQAQSASGRLLGAQQALAASTSSFILGQGHGTVFIENEIGKIHIIHNLFLDQLTANGIVGLLVLLFVYGFFLWLIGVALRKVSKNSFAERYLLWLVAAWLSVFVEQNLYRGFYNEYIAICLGIALYGAWHLTIKMKS